MTNPSESAPTRRLPLIALTMGDPAGVGPELCLRAVANQEIRAVCRPVIIGERSVLQAVGEKLNLAPPECVLPPGDALDRARLEACPAPPVIDCALLRAEDVTPGRATRAAGEASWRYITLAIEAALRGTVDATCTAPITKTTLKMAGITEPGHTEIFGRLTGTTNFAMLYYCERMAVSMVTCHQSLRSVPDSLTADEIRRVTHLTADALRRIRGREPKLVVLGLNPHAGEDGLFGCEDREIVAPAVERCRREGLDVEGPVPPDAAFMPHALARYDGHVTLYHDQGSIPFKMACMHDGVNVTMGLPIVRTSVDHGTAYDIAWQGKAQVSSLLSALRLAARLAQGSEAR